MKWVELPVPYTPLTRAERREVRLRYIEKQGGKCHHCKGDLKEDPPSEILEKRIHLYLYPPGFLDNPVHLHHDHNTDLTIGAVHAYCNAVLWEYYGE